MNRQRPLYFSNSKIHPGVANLVLNNLAVLSLVGGEKVVEDGARGGLRFLVHDYFFTTKVNDASPLPETVISSSGR